MKGWILVLIGIALSSKTERLLLKEKVAEQLYSKEYRFAELPSWGDEFDVDGLPDSSKWGYDIGSLYNGWGNNELQYYTKARKENVYIKDGVLTINAIKEEYKGFSFTSTRMVSREKGDFLYGRFVVRAKVPAGRGTWAAAWMLPTDAIYGGWPKSGEIDIMEHVGYDQDAVHITVHTEKYNHTINTQVGSMRKIKNATTEFHEYQVDWTPEYVKGYIDGEEMFEFKNEGSGSQSWPFDQRFHLLLNLAVGGNWGGAQGIDENAFPAAMQVDYVRVYKLLNP